MLTGDKSREIKLKGWDFTCRWDRGPRCYRMVVARAAKRHGNDLNRKEISEEVSEMIEEADAPRPKAGRRKKINQRERFGPHISVHCWGHGSYFLWAHYTRTTKGGELGLFESMDNGLYRLRRDPDPVIPLWIPANRLNARILGDKLLNLFKANPGLQEKNLPLRFTNGGPVVEPEDARGMFIPGVTSYLDHTGKLFHFGVRY